MAGINRALNSVKKNFALYETAEMRNKLRNCVFISHKYEDKSKAKVIGDYLMKILNLDIYLDENDEGLQDAIKRDDDRNIALSINRGIEESTHILCIISDSTKLSWWVPYEIGYAKRHGVDIASLKLKEISTIPSFLKIETTLNNRNELRNYYKSYSEPLSTFLENSYNEYLMSILD